MVMAPGARLHWPQVVAGYFIITLLYAWQALRAPHGATRPGFWQFMFPKEVWTHRSSLNDAIFTFMTFILMISLFNQWIFTPKFFMGLAQELAAILPPAEMTAEAIEPGFIFLLFYSFTALASSEFFYYWLHRAVHTFPALWEFHKVHHSAKAMTPLAVYRLHPVDFWLTGASKGFGVGLNIVIFAHFFPGIASDLKFLGTNVFVFFLGLLGGVLHHSHVWISFGPFFERLLISPAQHQIHHSEKPEHYNKNFSSVLSIWDWAFGTLYVTKWEKEKFTIGLGSEKEEAPYQNAWSMLYHPFKANIQMAAKRLKRKKKRAKSTV